MHTQAQTDLTTPTKPIALLPDHLISQIAAGEVVERPASVVKELLENALDAGANALVIRIDGGGIQRISIQDNGCGIPKTDLPSAVLRHATSKIASLSDLESVSSLGFRGEALASIASVSRFSLSSAIHNNTTSETQYAHCIHNHMGDWQIEPCALVKGTLVDVRDLYFCTPARRKFLKSEQSEFFACLDVVKRMALAYPDVQFEVYRDGKLYVRYVAMPHSQRIAKIVEVLSSNQSKPIGAEVGDLQLYGCVGLPEFARGRADAQYFYVNGRFVKDKLMTHAMRAAYQDVLHGDRHAAYVLFLQLPPHQVDVNVHPAKTEVRFRDAQAVHRWVRQVVVAALAELRGDYSHANIANSTTALPVSSRSTQYESMQLPFRQNHALATHDVLSVFDSFKPEQKVALTVPQSEGVRESSAPYGEYVQTAPNAMGVGAATKNALYVDDSQFLGEAIAQLHGTFILAQSQQGLIVVDVHAAHERVLYEQLKATLDAQAELPAQELLVPVVVDIQPQWSGVLPEAIALWARLGLSASLLNEHQLAVRSIPAMLKNRDVSVLVQTALHELHEHGVTHSDVEMRNAILAGLACRQAVKANQHLSVLEMNALLRAMETTARANQCNHGRPTWRCFSWAEMDAWFMRGQ